MQVKQILLLALFCAYTLSSYAQGSGSISGVVKDQSGVLPAITVKIAGSSRATLTNVNGAYSFQNVAAGSHTLIFTGVGCLQLHSEKNKLR